MYNQDANQDVGIKPSAELYTFGSPGFSGAKAVAAKSLVLLSYVCLEGPRSRSELTGLFWSHLEGQRSKRGERKDLKNYGVVRATLKRELGIDIEDAAQLANVRCDADLLREALSEGRSEEAFGYYRRGRFLEGIELCSRLHLSTEFLNWLDAQRLLFGRLVQKALLDMAQDPRQVACTLRLAEEIYEVERDGTHLGLLTQLHSLLTDLGSPLAFDAKRRLEQRVDALIDELTPDAVQLYLTLALQDTANLAAAQMAVNLSPQNAADCLEELRTAGLVKAQSQVLNQGVAELYLQQHKGVKIALLRALAEHTPTEQAFDIFQRLYELSHTFGGLGYWDKARAAYLYRAKILDEVEAYQALVDVLNQLAEAELDHSQIPDPKIRALHAFTLCTLGYIEQALAIIKDVPETLDILAVKSLALDLYGDFEGVRDLECRMQTYDTSVCDAWVGAQITNAAGVVAYADGNLSDAVAAFTEASALFKLTGKQEAALFARVRCATALAMSKRFEEAETALLESMNETKQNAAQAWATAHLALVYCFGGQVERSRSFNQKALEQVLEDKATEDPVLVANLAALSAYVSWRLGDEAREQLEQALELAQRSGVHRAFAIALGPLALLDRDVTKLETSLRMLEQIGDCAQHNIYAECYQALLKELWLDFDSHAAFKSLLQVSQQLHRYQEKQPDTLAQGAADALEELIKHPGCKQARAELRNHFLTQSPSGCLRHDAPRFQTINYAAV